MSIGVHPDIITAAALWWSDRLRSRAKQDNGDPGLGLAMALLLAEERPTADQVDKFEQALLELLRAAPDARVLSCDYGPEGLLAEAARHAGIVRRCPPFPMKTVMWISGRDVRVKTAMAKYQGDDKADLVQMCREEAESGSVDPDFWRSMLNTLNGNAA